MAGKKNQVSDIRALVADQVLGVEDIADRYGPGISTVRMWIKGAVPAGAPPFPLPATRSGKTHLYVAAEVGPWIEAHYRAATPPK
jgi:hypothetical protein